MLTKNIWNSLISSTRRELCVAVYGDQIGNHPHLQSLIDTPYRHNFDYNDYGRTLKSILKHCRLDGDGNIVVTTTITPQYPQA